MPIDRIDPIRGPQPTGDRKPNTDAPDHDFPQKKKGDSPFDKILDEKIKKGKREREQDRE